MTANSSQRFVGTARLAYRLLKREWRAGELRVLLAALVVTVASITAVGLFTDRMERAMETGANELLAAERLRSGAITTTSATTSSAAVSTLMPVARYPSSLLTNIFIIGFGAARSDCEAIGGWSV